MSVELITDSARKLLEKEYDLGFMRRYRTAEKPDKARLVQLCQEMGWHALIIGEEHGGFGYRLDAVCALLQELGRAAFPELYFSHFVAPVLVLNAVVGSPAKERVLAAIANSEWVPGMATNSATAASFSGSAAFRVEAGPAGDSISGATEFVCDVDSASLLVVPALRNDGLISVFAIEKDRPGVLIGERADQTCGKTFSVTCANVVPGEQWHLGALPRSALQDVYSLCAIAQSALMIGHAQRAMTFALEHIMVRKQFGKLLAEFQAVQHQAADMFRAVDVAQLFLAEAIEQCHGESMREYASYCKAWTNDAAFQTSATSHQLMGGTGYMVETDLQLLTSLILRGQYEFGSADYHREVIADLTCDRTV